MLRQRLSEALKEALKARDERTTATVRLILAALKDKDIAARGTAKPDALADADIQNMMQGMIKQRRESVEMFKRGARADLVEKEEGEIAVIERFLPQQMSEDEMKEAIKALVAELGIASVKDMGKAMAALKERYSGRMDFSKASGIVRQSIG
ncbi:MAG: GatB/YqeY domain-containing protein [Alphaproteobacteria bacterium]|nr:GatB/YqeY domain-containing protein [Alphaproteobacteria bacterium]